MTALAQLRVIGRFGFIFAFSFTFGVLGISIPHLHPGVFLDFLNTGCGCSCGCGSSAVVGG